MIIVSGTERSRTSLTMEILGKLGLKIIGNKWPKGEKSKHSAKLNPHGFYEIRGEVMHGTTKDYGDNSVIKVLLSGLVPHKRGKRQLGTSKSILEKSKIVLCMRNPKEVVKSIKELKDTVHIANGEVWETSTKMGPDDPVRYISRTAQFITYLANNKWLLDNIITIDTNEYYKDPAAIITYLCNELNLDKSKINDAVALVEPELYRHTDSYEWTDSNREDGLIAERIYKGLTSKKIITLAKDLTKIIKTKNAENIRWLDTEFGTNFMVNASLYRSLKINNRGIKDKLISSSKARIFTCSCQIPSEGEYTVHRPEDIGDLTRSMVHCTKDNKDKTLEQCHFCYNYKRQGK